MMEAAACYSDDLSVGTAYLLGQYRVSDEEIADFATKWDPQDFHVDPEAARGSHFGRLIASGVHTLAIFQRLTVPAVYAHWHVLAGRRIRDIELLHPVVGGMTLSGDVVIEAIQPQERRSLITTRGRLTSDGATVMESIFETYVHNRSGRI